MIAPVTDPVLRAGRQLDRVRAHLADMGIASQAVGWDVFGVGAGVIQGDAEFLVLSVPGAADGVLNITGGVLRDISRDRLPTLELCNALTRRNVACPAYLHDAPDGWDIHMQQRCLIDMVLRQAHLLRLCMAQLTAAVRYARSEFGAAGIGGEPYRWNQPDARRLLTRSLV